MVSFKASIHATTFQPDLLIKIEINIHTLQGIFCFRLTIHHIYMYVHTYTTCIHYGLHRTLLTTADYNKSL